MSGERSERLWHTPYSGGTACGLVLGQVLESTLRTVLEVLWGMVLPGTSGDGSQNLSLGSGTNSSGTDSQNGSRTSAANGSGPGFQDGSRSLGNASKNLMALANEEADSLVSEVEALRRDGGDGPEVIKSERP